MKTNTLPLQVDCFYHIYNRGINREPLFKEARNYAYFLKKFAQFVNPVADTYAYCLLSNHFHFLIKTRTAEDILQFRKDRMKDGDPNRIAVLHTPEWHISNQLAIFFRSYSLSVNKAHKRTGGLFEEPFRRIPVDTDKYLTRIIAYIHHNPQKHGFLKDFSTYKHSSYKSLISDLPTHLKRKEVLAWFGGKENFIAYHKEHIESGNAEEQW